MLLLLVTMVYLMTLKLESLLTMIWRRQYWQDDDHDGANDDGVLEDTQAGVIVDNNMEKAILTKMMIMMVQMMTVYLMTLKLESLLIMIWRRHCWQRWWSWWCKWWRCTWRHSSWSHCWQWYGEGIADKDDDHDGVNDDGVLEDTHAGVIVDNDMEKALLTKMMIMMVQMMTVYLKTLMLELLLIMIWRRHCWQRWWSW